MFRLSSLAQLLGSTVLALGVLAGCSKPAAPETAAPLVSLVTVAPRSVPDEISAAGTIEPVEKAQLAFLVPGRVQSIEVTDGAEVTAGQLLARLDDTDYRNEVAIAQAKLEETRAREARLRRLHELGSLTATDFEKITAGLTQAESAAKLARQRLAYTELHAPFAGRFTRSPISPGVVVGPTVPIGSVVAPAPVWATLSVPEVDAAQVRIGQPVRIRLAAREQVETTAPVEAILPQADALTRSFTVKVRLANTDAAFRPGNVVTASIALGSERAVLTLPPSAVQHFPDGALFVWVVDPERLTVTRRIISVGRTRGHEVQIESGLQAGERVVTSIAAPLFDGMRVSLAP